MRYIKQVLPDFEIQVYSDHGLDREDAICCLQHPVRTVSTIEALRIANEYYIGKFHSDINIWLIHKGYELQCIVTPNDSEVTGFVYWPGDDKFDPNNIY